MSLVEAEFAPLCWLVLLYNLATDQKVLYLIKPKYLRSIEHIDLVPAVFVTTTILSLKGSNKRNLHGFVIDVRKHSLRLCSVP